MTKALYITIAAALAASACMPEAPSTRGGHAAGFPDGTIVDLTHAFGEDTIYWPTSERFVLEKQFAGITEQGYYYSANNFRAAEHGGTHIDAPVHFFGHGRTLDAIPLERLIGDAVVIDVSAQSAADRDYRVVVGDIERWEDEHGRIPGGAIVLLRTGYARYWPDAERYAGTAERGTQAVAKLHFPGLHPDTARWLAENRSIGAIGLDTPSIDYGQSSLFEAHRILFENDIPALENLASLDRLPEVGFAVIALPMKIKGGTGGPLRVIAIVPDNG